MHGAVVVVEGRGGVVGLAGAEEGWQWLIEKVPIRQGWS